MSSFLSCCDGGGEGREGGTSQPDQIDHEDSYLILYCRSVLLSPCRDRRERVDRWMHAMHTSYTSHDARPHCNASTLARPHHVCVEVRVGWVCTLYTDTFMWS